MNRKWALPVNRYELISQIQTEWTRLMDVIAQLDAQQMSTPDAGGWSPRDNLAHVTEWMKFMLNRHIDRQPAHEVMNVLPEVIENWDVDRINQIFFERNKDRSTEDVLDELKSVYARTLEKLAFTPFEDLLKPLLPERADSPSLLEMGVLNNTRDHFAEHRETIEKTFKK